MDGTQQPYSQGLPSESVDQHMVYSSSILFEKSPIEAMEALTIRHQQAKQINKDLSEWLTSYGRLRLHYVDELKKLQKKAGTLFISDEEGAASATASFEPLGLVKPMWSDIIKNVEQEARYFDSSTRKMGKDMIAPLRLFARNNEAALLEMPEITAIAVALKSGDQSSEEEWLRRAPEFFEAFESYDYQRLNLLKEVFLKYQTDVSDAVDVAKRNSENGMQHVLNFNPDDEIERFSKDVVNKQYTVENIKLNNVNDDTKSKHSQSTAATGFTSASHVNTQTETFTDSNPNVSKRHSMFFHHKKDNESVSKRMSSNNSLFSTNTVLTSDKKKEKSHGVRSKFGSMFKKGKKGKDAYVPPSTIHEPDTASIKTSSTLGSSNILNNRQRGQPTPQSVRYSHPTETYSSSASSPVKEPVKPLPAQPQPQATQAPPQIEEESDSDVEEHIQEQPQQSQQQQQQQQQPVEKKPMYLAQKSESSLYQTMTPTKRSDSVSSSNFQQAVNDVITSVAPVPEMQNIPESTPLVTNPASVAPPPPTSRKQHGASQAPELSQNVSSSSTINRQSHGTAPTPPVQRKSMLIESNNQPTLQPAPTGGQRSETVNTALARNTTGGGGLVGGQILHPDLTALGLNSSIVELFNVSFKDGALLRSNAIGEVAFSFIVDENNRKLPSDISIEIVSKKNSSLPNFMVNPTFVQSAQEQGHFNIFDPSPITMRTVGALKYMLNNPTPPIIVTPIWKHEDNQSTVIISVKPTPELEDQITAGASLTLTNFMITVSVNNAIVSSAATKPSGSLNKEKGRVTWLTPTSITFNATKKEERYVARFMTNQLATESESGVQLRFNIANDDGARLIDNVNNEFEIRAKSEYVVEDPFGDGDNKEVVDWYDVPTMKSVVAGSYTAHA